MTDPETVIWKETASMRDFLVNPAHWLFTLVTLGLYTLVVYLSRLYTRYTLTNERLIKESGLLGKDIDEIELFRVKDSRVSQTLLQRLVGMGDIAVDSTDETGGFTMRHLPGAREKREQIRTMSNRSRESRGVHTLINE